MKIESTSKLIKTVSYYIIVILFLIYIYSIRNEISSAFNNIKYNGIILIIANIIPYIFVSSIFWISCYLMGTRLKIMEAFFLSIINSFLNYIVPAKAGLIYRGLYLKEKHNIGYLEYTGSTLTVQIINWGSSILLSLLSLVFISKKLEDITFYFYPLIAIFILIITSLSIIPVLKGKNTKIGLIANASHNLIRDKSKIFYLILLNFLHLAFLSYILYLVFILCGYKHIEYTDVLFIRSLANIVMFFSIIPGNIGILESTISIFSTIIGISFEVSIMITIIDRIFAFTAVLILSMVGFKYLKKYH